MEYNPQNTAIVVVDMQNDFCHPDGALYAEASEDAIEGVNEVIDRASGTVFYTQDTHREGAREFDQWGRHCVRGEWGHEFHDEVTTIYPSEIVQKDTYDAFHDTQFNFRLIEQGIDTLIICGTLVNVCVQETASAAAKRGFRVAVVSDAVGYLTEEQRESALSHIDFLIGEVITTEDL